MRKIVRRLTFSVLLFLSGGPILISPQASWAQDECAAQPVIIYGDSLSPLVSDGGSVMMKPLSCAGEIKRGDLAVFRTGARDKPVIKIIRALPGDHFSVKGGVIRVNKEVLTTSTGVSFHLAERRTGILALYEERYGGVIPPNTYLMLGDNPAGALDSSRIGLIHRSDIIMVGGERKVK